MVCSGYVKMGETIKKECKIMESKLKVLPKCQIWCDLCNKPQNVTGSVLMSPKWGEDHKLVCKSCLPIADQLKWFAID